MKSPVKISLVFLSTAVAIFICFLLFSKIGVFRVAAADNIVGISYSWTKVFQNDTIQYYPEDIEVDAQNNILVVGTISNNTNWSAGTIDLDMSSSTSNALGTSFFGKYSPSGALIFGFALGSEGPDLTNQVSMREVSSDSDNNIYITGDFSGTVQFDFTSGTSSKTSHDSGQDIFVMKVNSNGTFAWVKTFGGDVYDGGKGIVVDKDSSRNAFYVAGTLNTQYPADIVDMDPGAGVRNSTVKGEFISKFDLGGNFVWAKEYGPTGYSDGINDVAIQNSTGNVYVEVGHSASGYSGTGGMYLQKLDADGNVLGTWTTESSNGLSGIHPRITLDQQENVILSGDFEGTMDLDPTAGVDSRTSASANEDVYITKINADGTYAWTKTFGGNGRDRAFAVEADSLNNYYIGGWFTGTTDFDFSAGVDSHTAGSAGFAFVSMVNQSGDYVKAYVWGGAGDSTNDAGVYGGLAINTQNVLYALGGYMDDVDFDPTSHTYMIHGSPNTDWEGEADIFVSKFLPIYSNGEGDPGTPGVPGVTYSDDSTLSDLTIQGCDLSPAFNAGRLSYTCVESTTVTSAMITATASSDDSRISIAGHASESGVAREVSLPYGTTHVQIDVIAEDTVSNSTYDVSIYNPFVDGTYYEYESSITVGNSGARVFPMNSASDANGNLYLIGTFSGAIVDFDPGAGEAMSPGTSGDFILKLNAAMEFQWVKFINSSVADPNIEVDDQGNIYYGGAFSGTIDVDPSGSVVNITALGGNDGYLVKLDTAGNYQWSKSWGKAGSSDEYVGNLIADSASNVYVVGELGDPQTNSTVSVNKLDTAGNSLWFDSFGNSNGNDFYDWQDVAVDSQNNVFIIGLISGGQEFDADPSETEYTNWTVYSGGYYITKIFSNGSWGDTRIIDAAEDSTSLGGKIFVDLDQSNNIFISGTFDDGGLDLNPDPDVTNTVTQNGYDTAFIVKLDSGINYLWGYKFDSARNVNPSTLMTNADGNVFISGTYEDQMDINPSTEATNNVQCLTGYDPFYVELNSAGVYVDSWFTLLNSDASADPYTMTFGSQNEMYLIGDFSATQADSSGLDFDGDDTAEVSSVGQWDGYVARYAEVLPEQPPSDLSTDSSLSSLTISDCTLNPAFDSDTTAYTCSINASVDYVSVTPTVSFASAAITVNGNSDISGNAVQVAMNTGTNSVEIVVTAEDSVTTSTYGVTITKAEPVVEEDDPTGSITVNSGNAYTSTTTANITLSSTPEYQMMICKNSDFTGCSWEAFSSSKTWTLPEGDGLKTVYAKYRNSSSVESEVYSDNIILDTSAPTGNISINDGIASTETPNIVLNILGIDTTSGVSEMMVCEDSSFTGCTWESYNATKYVVLSSGDGVKTIYARYKDNAGLISEIFNDTIVLSSKSTVDDSDGDNPVVVVPDTQVPQVEEIITQTGQQEEESTTQDTEKTSTVDSPTQESSKPTLKNSVSVLATNISTIGKKVKDVVDQLPISEEASQNITTATLALVAVTPVVSVGLGSSTMLAYILRFFSTMLALLGIGKKKRNCGLVYNSVTKEPLSNAVVRIYDTNGSLVSTEVTNTYGIFETNISSGQYSILVQANGYKYPSILITGAQDLPYENVYRGGTFSYDSSSSISYSIPVDPIDKSNTEYASTIARNKLINVSSFLLNVFILVGLVFSVISYIKLNSTLNLVLLLVYTCLIVLGIIVRKQEKYKFGTVTDTWGDAQEGVELGLMETEFNTLYAKRVTNDKGKYRFIVPGGEYKLVLLNSQNGIEDIRKVITQAKGKQVFAISTDVVIKRT